MSTSSADRPRPVVGMYVGRDANPGRLTALLEARRFRVTPVERGDLAAVAGRGVDVLYLPGGWYRFDEPTNRAVVAYVEAGGACVGSCAGSYLVAGHIGLIPGRTLRANIRGRVYLEPQQGEHPILRGVVRRCARHNERTWEPIAVTHLGGPLMLPVNRECIVASYDAEGQVAALVAADVGRGRAVAIASHPEWPLAPLPPGDTVKSDVSAFQGDESAIVVNAVLWAARREDLIGAEGA